MINASRSIETTIPRGVTVTSETNRPLGVHLSPSIIDGACNIDLHYLHSQPTVAFILWQTYLERVDPVLKIIHVPTIQHEVLGAIIDFSKARSPVNCLISSIFYAAVVTMSPKECTDELRDEKTKCLKRYAHRT